VHEPTHSQIVGWYAGEAEILRLRLEIANERIMAAESENIRHLHRIRTLERRIAIAAAVGILAAGAYLYLRFAA
jgi:hypothetical protein